MTEAITGSSCLLLIGLAVWITFACGSPQPTGIDKLKLQQNTCVFALLQPEVTPDVVEYCKELLKD